ncbi:hypothetical protein [Microbulbifer epialgicus]|uniref:Uncharacterized protein n=1 Tax=Microbulbifer epialgicus TaxID=393907 RepID=A0ABV4P5R1_9GAMM
MIPLVVVLLDQELIIENDEDANVLLNEAEWRGYNDSDPNAAHVGGEGVYIFVDRNGA